MTEFFQWFSGGSTSAMVFLTIMVIAIIVVILIYLIAFFQPGREISFWPPKIGEKPNGKSTENKQSVAPLTLEPSTVQQIVGSGLVHAFRIPSDNAIRLRRICELIEEERKGSRKLRLAAISGFSYLSPNGPVWTSAGLGKLIVEKVVDIVVVLESPFSQFALTRALANDIEMHHWQDKQDPYHLISLLQYPNVSIRVTNMAMNCSLFLTSQAIYYDPYLWALPHSSERCENKFWVLEFAKVNDRDRDCYSLLEKHFEFLFLYSVPLEEILHKPEKNSQLPRGVAFHNFYKKNPELALNLYEKMTKDFKHNVRSLKVGQS